MQDTNDREDRDSSEDGAVEELRYVIMKCLTSQKLASCGVLCRPVQRKGKPGRRRKPTSTRYSIILCVCVCGASNRVCVMAVL